jgi:hypothetical protein
MQVPDTSAYYSSSIHYAYLYPDVPGGIVGIPFCVNWSSTSATASTDPEGYVGVMPQATSWTQVSLTRGAPGNNPPLTAGWLRFQFLSSPLQGTGGQGVTIDDVQVTGYVFGPPVGVTATRNAGDSTHIDVSWSKPLAPGTQSADPRSIWYRVWRHDLAANTWAEVTTDATSATAFADTGVSAYKSYAYTVQGYESATETVTWGVSADSGSVSALPLPSFTIGVSAGPGGTISPSTTQTVSLGANSPAFAIAPNSGYEIATVTVDGSSIGTPTTYTFTNVSADHTIAATFSLAPTPTVPPVTKAVGRESGSNRYLTALLTMQAAFPGWSGVHDLVLASGDYKHQPDALTAAGLAGAYNAPLLLVASTSLDSDVKAAIGAMPSGLRVHVVGGAPSVSDTVLSKIRAIKRVKSVDRISGKDRFATGVAVATRMKSVLGGAFPHVALVTSGADSALLDPLIAGTVSARKHFPVMLVNRTSVPSSTAKALASLGLSTRYIVGGEGTVAESVRTTLGISAGNRIAGADLPGDAAALATRAQTEGWLACTRVGFAAAVPDAATGGVFMGRLNGPMLLVRPTSVPDATSAYLSANHATIVGGTVFGGLPSVSEQVRQTLLGAMN